MNKKFLNNDIFNKTLTLLGILLVILLAFSGQIFLYKSTDELSRFLNILNIINIKENISLWIGIGCYITAIVLFISLVISKKFKPQDDEISLFEKETVTNSSNKKLGITFLTLAVLLLLALFIILVIYNFYNHYLLILWAASIISGGLSVYFFDKAKPDLSFYKIDLKEGFFLLSLLALFLSLTLPYIDLIPRFIEVDEGNMGLFARTFSESTMNLMGYSGFFGIPNLSFFQIYVFSLPFGLDISGIRHSAVLLGAISMIIFYFASRLMFNKNVAAISSIILITSHIYIAYTRTAYHHFQGIFQLSLFMLVFMLALKQKNNLLMFLSGAVLGFGFYLYYSPRVILPILLCYLLYLFIRNFKEKKVIIQWVLSGLLGFIVVLSPLLFETIKTPENFNARVSDVYIFQDEGYRHTCSVHNTNNKFMLWICNLKNAVSGLFFMKCGGNTYFNTRPYMDLYSSMFFVFGFILFCFMFKDYRYLFVLLSFIIIFIIGGSMTVDALCYQRVVIMLPTIAIIIGISLVNFSTNIENSFSNKLLRNILKRLFIFLSIIIIIALNFETYFNHKIINIQEESIFDCNTTAAYLIKDNLKKYDFYVVNSNYTFPMHPFYGSVDLRQPPVRFLHEEKELFHEIDLNENDLAIKNNVKKDIAFIVSNHNLYINLNILLKQYPGGKVVRYDGGNEYDVKFFVYAVPKEIINSKIND